MIFFSGCGIEYIQTNGTLIKKVQWDTRKEYDEFEKNNKDAILDGYKVEFYQVKPYLIYPHSYLQKEISLKDKGSFAQNIGLIPYSKHTISYTFMMFTLNEEPYNKTLQSYFKEINATYEDKSKEKNINQFVEYECDTHIFFSRWERDEDLNPLLTKCYAKRLEDDVFLITRFGYPNTQKDKDVFQNEIIPKMLEGIKLTPTKLSPWKYD